MKRRAFIKNGCTLCAGLAGIYLTGTLLEGCAPGVMIFNAENNEGRIVIPIEKFADRKHLIVRSKHLEFDLLVVKETESSFHTLAMQCTHRQQPLVFTSTGLFCNEHGSRFDLNGNVLRDPATKPLLKFKTELADGSVIVRVS